MNIKSIFIFTRFLFITNTSTSLSWIKNGERHMKNTIRATRQTLEDKHKQNKPALRSLRISRSVCLATMLSGIRWLRIGEMNFNRYICLCFHVVIGCDVICKVIVFKWFSNFIQRICFNCNHLVDSVSLRSNGEFKKFYFS